MIVITGATGRLGGAVVERLLDRVPAAEVGVAVRDASRATHLADRGVRVREADFAAPETLPHAFDGATQVLVVSGPADAELHRPVLRAAVAAGAERVLYTSHQAADPASAFAATVEHARTERDLAEAGVAYTALRNGYYAVSAIQLMGQALTSGRLVLPEDGPASWTAHADLADAAVVALTGPGRLDGVTPPLTGPELLDFEQLAAIASEVTGREIEYVRVPDDEWLAGARASGMTEELSRFFLGIFVAARRGEFAVLDPTLEQLVGRRPATFRDVLASTLDAAPRPAGRG
ncbi:NmrA family NAD(P)-binding protein [Promicromonospora thailandica]|uniref:Uncharacterized conserved protein YbjT, contains NAD(P)-binding and DUF2867 domains n=1 Tax=Promicromonospora thailandica TaxID=765201 RepID=A0A9X2JTE0_9MICO|nr:NmrA family NAD(P)-binding protein [Promicromonospora thailandica]MCP2262861.1 Uncharacterized conserved protein YbjT, contains NAD(P)-binding and DUF2867 domains [Promicromonospora thailandica]BFF18199.1 NAD(P)H-binding protein [Promicromonospora thailandica]